MCSRPSSVRISPGNRVFKQLGLISPNSRQRSLGPFLVCPQPPPGLPYHRQTYFLNSSNTSLIHLVNPQPRTGT